MSGLWPHIIKWTLFPGQDENTILGMSTFFFTTLQEARYTWVVSTVSTTFPYCLLALEDKQCYRVALESEMPTQPKWGMTCSASDMHEHTWPGDFCLATYSHLQNCETKVGTQCLILKRKRVYWILCEVSMMFKPQKQWWDWPKWGGSPPNKEQQGGSQWLQLYACFRHNYLPVLHMGDSGKEEKSWGHQVTWGMGGKKSRHPHC